MLPGSSAKLYCTSNPVIQELAVFVNSLPHKSNDGNFS